jgi:hypothetical protein
MPARQDTRQCQRASDLQIRSARARSRAVSDFRCSQRGLAAPLLAS